MMGHTPGPWESIEIDSGRLVVVIPDCDVVIAEINLDTLEKSSPEANARLIAAAPTMLSALVEAEKHFGEFAEITINGEHHPGDVRAVELIRAAIALATGETK